MTKIVLASASPRRRELLAALVDDFVIDPTHVEESLPSSEPERAAELLALRKAGAAAQTHPDAAVIGSDTIVHDGTRFYEKPASPGDAIAMLTALRGREHIVATGVAVIRGDSECSAVNVSRVTIADLSEAQIRDYVASGRPMDKAGAYAIQDADVPTVAGFEGCFCGVMGLPLWTLRSLLAECGVPTVEPHTRIPRCAECPARELSLSPGST
jgi:septum formation protein